MIKTNQDYLPKQTEYLRISNSMLQAIEKLGFKTNKNEVARILINRYPKIWWIYRSETTEINGHDKLWDKLHQEINVRSNPRIYKEQYEKSYLSASELADYTFCPASYSIKKTFEVPETLEMEIGEQLHEKRHMEGFLKNLKNKKHRWIDIDYVLNEYYEGRSNGLRKWQYFLKNTPYKNYLLKLFKSVIIDKSVADAPYILFPQVLIETIYHQQKLQKKDLYAPLLYNSKIIFRGHTKSKIDPFMSKNGLFCGIPDYIFKTNNNDNFVVEEKHTWQEVVSKPWDSHIIQVLSYMYGIPFNNKKMKNGYIIYFSWYPKKNNYCNLETRNPRLFKIERNKQNLEKVNRVYNNVKNFNNSKKIKFNIKDLNIKKCLNCSARIYCDHMNGDKKYLELPYNF